MSLELTTENPAEEAYHTVGFFELEPRQCSNDFQRYYILEGKPDVYNDKKAKLVVLYPQAKEILLHERIPDSVNVVDNLHKECDTNARIAINERNFCVSYWCESVVLELIFKMCKVADRPKYMRSARYTDDHADGEYESIVL